MGIWEQSVLSRGNVGAKTLREACIRLVFLKQRRPVQLKLTQDRRTGGDEA